MAPIVSPKLLSQIVMHGCTVEVSKACYVKVLYADLEARPVAVCKPKVVILGSVLPRQRRALVPCAGKTSYSSLPNFTFILDPEDACSEVSSKEGSLVSAPESASIFSLLSNDEGIEQLEQTVSESVNSLKVCPETESVATCVSSVPSIASSTSSCELPSTAATSIPPWEASKSLGDPVRRFGAPPATSHARSCSPVDSLDIIRHRRASETVDPNLSSSFAPRARKYSDVRGLKSLGLRGLEIFKKVKW